MRTRQAKRNKWLTRTPSPAAAGRVFLIPYSGCGASLYRHWPEEQEGIEFLPVELPGRDRRFAEPSFGSYQELATAMTSALAEYLHVPFAFFGHCASALAAYEVSAELIRTGMPAPARLFVSSEVAPQDGPAGSFLQMSEAELSGELETLIRQLGGEPNPELISLYLEVLISDISANKGYVVPEPFRLSCPITAIGWTEDTDISHSAMSGWTKCGDTFFELLPGRHHQFIDAPPELLAVLGAHLNHGTRNSH
jgi:surfactin synthase thioesterase subunit